MSHIPPGPYRVEWPEEQGGLATLWGKQGTPPDGWAIPLVARGTPEAMEELRGILTERDARLVSLADAIHEAMPDESNWQQYLRRVDEPDGWYLEITRDLSRHIAAYLEALGYERPKAPV